jgi:hypothetical protein
LCQHHDEKKLASLGRENVSPAGRWVFISAGAPNDLLLLGDGYDAGCRGATEDFSTTLLVLFSRTKAFSGEYGRAPSHLRKSQPKHEITLFAGRNDIRLIVAGSDVEHTAQARLALLGCRASQVRLATLNYHRD